MSQLDETQCPIVENCPDLHDELDRQDRVSFWCLEVEMPDALRIHRYGHLVLAFSVQFISNAFALVQQLAARKDHGVSMACTKTTFIISMRGDHDERG